ncbi:MAG: phage Gp37/Gp68 family protein [Myxococcales bacterium]|nr:phage Gp37/Gp68 family protein [Myxococcales bacterium]
MGKNTLIEWTHHTFNGWEGCQKVGPGCDHCYAETRDARFGGGHWGPHAARRRTGARNWNQPRKWDREAAALGERHRVFCSSLSDVMDTHASVLPEWRRDLAALIRATPNLDWLLLTKRVGNAERILREMFPEGVPANLWLGATIVNQEEANRDIPKLLRVKGELGISIVFLSMEPLLGPVVLPPGVLGECRCNVEAEDGAGMHDGRCPATRPRPISWVIAGGESGGKARPSSPDWYRMIRDRCTDAGVPFLFKQWGEWAPLPPEGVAKPSTVRTVGGRSMERVGKAAAGRLLDGVKYDGVPW